MKDEEFVKSIYAEAKLIVSECKRGTNRSIEINAPNGHRYIGWNVNHTDDLTWWYARQDIIHEMTRKLES